MHALSGLHNFTQVTLASKSLGKHCRVLFLMLACLLMTGSALGILLQGRLGVSFTSQ